MSDLNYNTTIEHGFSNNHFNLLLYTRWVLACFRNYDVFRFKNPEGVRCINLIILLLYYICYDGSNIDANYWYLPWKSFLIYIHTKAFYSRDGMVALIVCAVEIMRYLSIFRVKLFDLLRIGNYFMWTRGPSVLCTPKNFWKYGTYEVL